MWRLLLVAPLARSASLCDKLAGAPGLSEICAAPAEACVAAFGGRPRASCDDVCGAAGLACHGAFDDLNDDGRCPAGEPVACGRALFSKVCQCGVSGAAAAAIPAAAATPAWSPTDCELLSREILAPADAATGALAVHRLRFAFPANGSWPAAPAHVKARAPDAPGQRMRVRAYSARVCDDGASFNVTVKIYPGGPPATRGTSAFMGAIPLGGALDVPQVRSLRWARPLAELGNVGIIAFGVGVAEAVEAVEDVLAASAAVVCLFAAYRDGSQILYRDHFRALLAAHPGRLRIRYYLSRAAADAEDVCVDGEETVPRRLDARLLRAEIGSWDPASSRFLVIGTGSMEGAAWSWLGILGFEGRRLFEGHSGWRNFRAPAPKEPALPAAPRRAAAPARPRRPAATGSI